MPGLGEIATIVFGKGGKVSGLPTEIIKGLLKGQKYLTADGHSINIFRTNGKTWLNFYTRMQQAAGKGRGVQTGKVGQLYTRTERLFDGTINKRAMVNVGNNEYEQACCGFGHFFNKRGVKTDHNPIHYVEQMLNIG